MTDHKFNRTVQTYTSACSMLLRIYVEYFIWSVRITTYLLGLMVLSNECILALATPSSSSLLPPALRKFVLVQSVTLVAVLQSLMMKPWTVRLANTIQTQVVLHLQRPIPRCASMTLQVFNDMFFRYSPFLRFTFLQILWLPFLIVCRLRDLHIKNEVL